MHAVTGITPVRQPTAPAALDRRLVGELRLEARRDMRLVVAVLCAAITTGIAALVHSLS